MFGLPDSCSKELIRQKNSTRKRKGMRLTGGVAQKRSGENEEEREMLSVVDRTAYNIKKLRCDGCLTGFVVLQI